jgi:hypothetical protein
VPRDVARRKIETPAQRDRHVREVAANAEALRQHLAGRRVRAARAPAILDVFMHPIADRLHAPQPLRHLAKFREREIHEPIRVAVPARERVAEQLRRHLAHRQRHIARLSIFRQGRHRHEGVVPDGRPAHGQFKPPHDIPMHILVHLCFDAGRKM